MDVQQNGTSKILLDLQETVIRNLKIKQRDKIIELRERMSDVLGTSHNEYYFLKWLRARNFDVGAAENMLRAHLKWRAENRVDTILQEFVSPEVLVNYYPFGCFTNDKEGNPIWIIPIGRIDIKGLLYSVSKSDFMKFLISQFESSYRNMKPQSEKLGKLIEWHTVIFDMEDFDIRWALWKPAFDLLISYLRMYEANYPESLKIAFIINAPKIFTMFFTMVKPFLSEETRKKITIYGKGGWKDVLLEKIEENQLPKHWGGSRVDETDGNEFCSPKVIMGGPVPKSFHMLQSENSFLVKDMHTKVVNPREKFTVDFNVEELNSTMNWAFKTEDHDISFGVTFEPVNATDNKQKTKTYLVPIDRSNSHMVPEEGTLICTEIGKYTLVFDNSFSWYRGKKLCYNARVQPPE